MCALLYKTQGHRKLRECDQKSFSYTSFVAHNSDINLKLCKRENAPRRRDPLACNRLNLGRSIAFNFGNTAQACQLPFARSDVFIAAFALRYIDRVGIIDPLAVLHEIFTHKSVC